MLEIPRSPKAHPGSHQLGSHWTGFFRFPTYDYLPSIIPTNIPELHRPLRCLTRHESIGTSSTTHCRPSPAFANLEQSLSGFYQTTRPPDHIDLYPHLLDNTDPTLPPFHLGLAHYPPAHLIPHTKVDRPAPRQSSLSDPMSDRPNKQSPSKGGATAADMAARPFQCEWPEGCSKVRHTYLDLYSGARSNL